MLCCSSWLAQRLFPDCDERTRLVLPKGANTSVMSRRSTHILSPWLPEERVGVCTAKARLCLVWKNRGVLWSGLERFSQTFDGLVVMVCLLVCWFSFFHKCRSESGQHPRGASLLDITIVYLSTLSVLSWPQAETHIMRKGTSLIICLLDWQSCMGDGRCRSLGMLQLLW